MSERTDREEIHDIHMSAGQCTTMDFGNRCRWISKGREKHKKLHEKCVVDVVNHITDLQ